jgi:proline iminopeptidase
MRPTTDSQHEWKGDQDVRVTSSKARSKEPRLRRELYPPIDCDDSGWLEVSELHSLYWEVSGNPAGQAVVFLHGGPGSGTSSENRRFFDPKFYRIVLFDQRGAGKSTPHACLEENTTWDLVDDIEKIRKHLGIDTWQVNHLLNHDSPVKFKSITS